MPETLRPIADALRDHYDVERELGRGGMATVYLAQDRKHGRRVAIKVLDQALTSGAERFLREIQIIARLNHPHVLPLFDSGQAGQFLYYVMPYIAGESLRARLRRETRLPPDEAIRLARQVADALDYAHGEGVIHRDVKPENILLSRGHALVADFGIARAVSAATDATRGDTLTQIGVAIGTPAYMSPEQAMAERELGPQTDIYSLACVLFEMLGGEPPFTGTTPAAVIAKRLSGPVPSLARTIPGFPPHTDAAIARALSSEPSGRFPTASAFAAALEEFGVGVTVSGSSAPARASVAVLPFAALSAGADDDYFSDGVTEDIITRLGKIKSIKVISRNSVMRFKGSTQSTREIANALGVQTLLQGSVRCSGDRLRVTAQLIDATTDEHLWADTYDRRMTDVFEVQADVAESISDALASHLSTAERQRLRQSPAMDVETYNLCLLGRHHWHRWTEPDFHKSIEYYKQALERSPDSAMAHAGLGMGYATLGLGYWSVHGPEYHPLAKRALQRAVELHPEYPDAQGWLAILDRQYEFAWDQAERRCRQALYSNPNSATLHDILGGVLTATGRHAEARASCVRAGELDPLSYFILANAALAAYRARDYDASLEFSRRGIKLDPNLPMSYGLIALPLLQLGRADEALTNMDEALRLHFSAVEPFKVALLVAARRAGEARSLLSRLEDRRRTQHVWPLALAAAYAHLGDKDAAFACLNDAYNERDFWVGWLAVEPSLDPLRSDRRFAELLARVNLEYAVAPAESPRAFPSLAVLPFENLSPDPDTDYFSDGLTEEILTDLSQVQALRVLSRSATIRLKNTDKDARLIGRELGVQYVLRGGVRRAAGKLRITAQLIDTRTDVQLWGEKFSGTTEEVFDVQERVSRAIMNALGARLTPREEKHLAVRAARDPRAYDLYLRARAELWKWSAPDARRALEFLEEAQALEPDNPSLLGSEGMALIIVLMTGSVDLSLRVRIARCAERALALEPDSIHGHYTGGWLGLESGDLRSAATHFKAMLARERNNGDALSGLTCAYIYAGKQDASRVIAERFKASDPQHPHVPWLTAGVDWFDGRTEAAIATLRTAVKEQPGGIMPRWHYCYVLALDGQLAECEEHLLKLQQADATSPYTIQIAALLDALAGRVDRARKRLETTKTMRLDGHISYHMAEAFAAAGLSDDAFRLLNRALENGFYPNTRFTSEYCPFFAPIRSDVRFSQILTESQRRSDAFEL